MRRRTFLASGFAAVAAPSLMACSTSDPTEPPGSGASTTGSAATTGSGTGPGGFAARAARYLSVAAQHEPASDASRARVWRATAQAVLGQTPELSVADLETITERFARFEDTTDFDMVALINLWYRSDFGAMVPEETAAHLRRLILEFKYWYTEPQPEGITDERWYWSENHQILFHVIEYLAGQAFPDETFTNDGRSGSDHMDHARPLIERWVEQRTRWGFSEWYSAVYYQEDLEAAITLAEFSDDEDLATLGAIAACMLPFAVWTVRNRIGTGSWAGDRPGSRTDLAGAISSFVATLRDWVAPESITAIVVVAVIVVTAVVLLADTTPGASVRNTSTPQLNTVVPWVAFIAAYVGFQLVAQLTTSLDGLGTRLLAPVWPALVVTGALVAEHLAERGRAARLAGWLIVAWLALIATSTAAELRTWSRDGRAYAQPRWRSSQLLRQVELLPPDALLVSDQPGAIVVFTDRRSAIEPPVSSPFGTTVPGPANRDRFVRSIACAPAGAYLVWFDDAPRELFTPEQIGRLVTTTEVASTSDGAIWRLDAPAQQTC